MAKIKKPIAKTMRDKLELHLPMGFSKPSKGKVPTMTQTVLDFKKKHPTKVIITRVRLPLHTLSAMCRLACMHQQYASLFSVPQELIAVLHSVFWGKFSSDSCVAMQCGDFYEAWGIDAVIIVECVSVMYTISPALAACIGCRLRRYVKCLKLA